MIGEVGGAGAKAKARPIPPIPASYETILSTNTPDEDKNVEVGKNILASLEAGRPMGEPLTAHI